MSAPMSGTRTFHMIEAVADRLEGAPQPPRRRWSDAFKAQLVAEALEPGASVSMIAHRVGIRPSQLFAWRRKAVVLGQARKIDRGADSARFVPYEAARSDVVELCIGDVTLRVNASIDPALLSGIVTAVRKA